MCISHAVLLTLIRLSCGNLPCELCWHTADPTEDNDALSLLQKAVQRGDTEGRQWPDASQLGTGGLVGEQSIIPYLKRKLQGRPFTYIVNVGNGGDAVIQHSTMLVFDQLGLQYDMAAPMSDHFNKTLVVAGAGELINTGNFLYGATHDFLLANAKPERGNSIIILPSTIIGYADLIQSLGSNVVIFAREYKTYDYLMQVVRDATVFLSKDMAFYLQDFDIVLQGMMRDRDPTSSRVGLMLRTDAEGITMPESFIQGNRDLSAEGFVEFVQSTDDTKKFLKMQAHHVLGEMSTYGQVWTNRLHLCISGALLGVETHCMDNNYGKIKAVFDFSLRAHFANVHFEGNGKNAPWMNATSFREPVLEEIPAPAEPQPSLESDMPDGDEPIVPFLEKELKGKRFTYIVNPGGASDALIQHGTMLLFDKLGFEYDMAPPGDKHENKILVYSGAGELVQTANFTYWSCKTFLERNAAWDKGNKIILLPATIVGHSDLLHSLGPNVVIFTGEYMSYKHVQQTGTAATLFMSKDMSFYLQDLDPILPSIIEARNETSRVGMMLRTDAEGPQVPEQVRVNNRDLSTEGHVEYADSVNATKLFIQTTAHRFLREVAKYDQIWTNRIHLCIAGVLLKLQAVHCMDNSFGKEKAMYDFSIAGQFSNAHWDGNADALPWKKETTNQPVLIAVTQLGAVSATVHRKTAHGGIT